MHKLITFEGLPGSGKTTISKRFVQETNAVYIKTPTEPFEKIRGQVDALESKKARALYYLADIVALSDQINTLLKTKNVIVDKYIDCVEVYQKLNGMYFKMPMDWVQAQIRKPDWSFFLNVDQVTRKERLSKRNPGLTQTNDEENERLIKLYKEQETLIEIPNNGNIEEAVTELKRITQLKPNEIVSEFKLK